MYKHLTLICFLTAVKLANSQNVGQVEPLTVVQSEEEDAVDSKIFCDLFGGTYVPAAKPTEEDCIDIPATAEACTKKGGQTSATWCMEELKCINNSIRACINIKPQGQRTSAEERSLHLYFDIFKSVLEEYTKYVPKVEYESPGNVVEHSEANTGHELAPQGTQGAGLGAGPKVLEYQQPARRRRRRRMRRRRRL